jgi:membrane-associated protease RseP (regulator of RpoE activity)
MVELFGWIALILVVLAGATFFIKKYVKGAQTWIIVSMVRFTKPLKIFDLFVKHPKWVNALTDIGLVLGFGAVAIDYLWMQKRPIIQRLIVFIASVAVLGFFTSLIFPTENPIIPIPPLITHLFFGVFGMAGLILVSLFYSGLDIITKLSAGKNACAGVAPVIPGVDLPNSPISVPLHAWLSFVIILIIHEASHGFVIRKLGMTLKSYGLLLLGFLPIGAFVEPDEKQLKQLEKKQPKEALRMYAAGPASNFYFFVLGGIVFAALGGLLIGPALMPLLTNIHLQTVNGVEISEVQEKIDICGTEFEAPAHGVLQPGDQILSVDGNPTHMLSDYSLAVREKENYTLTIMRNGETQDYSFEPNELGRIGITVREIPNPDYIPPFWYEPLRTVLGFIAGFLGWLLLLNFLVATANYIPVDPFDGGKMAKILVAPYLGFMGLSEEDTKMLVGKLFGLIFLVLVIINAAPLLIVNP